LKERERNFVQKARELKICEEVEIKGRFIHNTEQSEVIFQRVTSTVSASHDSFSFSPQQG